ncbi:MAG: hypothetical protein JKY37_31980 [Nannocystaceae bacterium]|nr:hypothetical protein [Nannocystaceae bacterium]
MMQPPECSNAIFRVSAVAGALVGALVFVACSDRSSGVATEPGCDEYLACLAEIDSQTFEDELPTYGSNGTCFDGSDATNCHTVCRERLEAIDATADACNPPEPEPEPEPDPVGDGPTPEADGSVNCAEIQSGPTVGPGDPGPTGFPETWCNPRTSGDGTWKCCSDDPAAEGGAPPNYVQKNIEGGATPYFSGPNNGSGTSGLCVNTGDIPAGSGLQEPAALNCPIPCNPTWQRDEVDVVCGVARVCCQTRELQVEDCVQGPDDAAPRPVTGADIGALTDWNAGAHATHQDPAGTGCTGLAGGDQSSPVFTDCIAQLTVANQRGYCLAMAPGQACATAAPTYIDACSQ